MARGDLRCGFLFGAPSGRPPAPPGAAASELFQALNGLIDVIALLPEFGKCLGYIHCVHRLITCAA